MQKLRTQCRFFLWDRPCEPHKREGVHCGGCSSYEPFKDRLLVIKLDSLGDVLRTTCILPALKEKFPHAQVTWITMAEAMPLLENNPSVDRVVAYGPDALALLGCERFDRTFCLDAAPRSAALGSLARSRVKRTSPPSLVTSVPPPLAHPASTEASGSRSRAR